ncbi:MAG: class I SAM-dependent methyltransferase [Acidobacteria bacterium]|nr:class I SAM-dependent methyltransferase [Acidobacteriota bacterium]
MLDFWKKVFDEQHIKGEADFILELMMVPPGAAILDVSCREGRLSRELASGGSALTGVDHSGDFLNEARSKAAALGLNIQWKQCNMRGLPWQSSFDGAFCFGGSFGYFEDQDNADFLNVVCRSLKPAARFVLETSVSTETLLPRLLGREWTRFGDSLLLEENQYDHLKCRLNTDYTIIRDGHAETRFSSRRIYTYRELIRLLECDGFTHVPSFGSLAGDQFKRSSPQLFLVGKVKG